MLTIDLRNRIFRSEKAVQERRISWWPRAATAYWRIMKICYGIAYLLFAAACSVQAQVDALGKPDTVYAEINKIDDNVWSISFSLTNDEPVVGLSIPFKMTAGLNRIVADSAVYTGGRVAESGFAYRGFRVDTTIQCVLLGMIANLGPSKVKLAPGTGRLVTVFVSSLDDKPITKLSVDTTTMHPDNVLMLVSDSMIGTVPDTTTVPQKDRSIYPAWVIRKN